MGLKGDIDEVARVWNSAPWRVRLFLAISAFLASSAFASLSDAVFRWKGFLLEGVNAYREYVGRPIVDLFAHVIFNNKPIPESFADHVFVVVVMTTAILRMEALSGLPRTSRVAIAVASLNQLVALAALEGSWLKSWFSWTFYALFCLSILAFERGARRLLGIVYMTTPLIVVSILAAVNSGLTRTS